MQTPQSGKPSPLVIDTLFPELYNLILEQQSDMQCKVQECIGGSGDEVLLLRKNQVITLPPHTV